MFCLVIDDPVPGGVCISSVAFAVSELPTLSLLVPADGEFLKSELLDIAKLSYGAM
jgi:hypothetical protein